MKFDCYICNTSNCYQFGICVLHYAKDKIVLAARLGICHVSY